MENIEKRFNLLKSLENDFSKNVSDKAEEVVQASLNERKQRIEKVDLDKDFDNLLSDSNIRNVFIRLRDK
ncbi:hypothetical protein BHC44_07935 [Snodgrassella alvi]|jgi:hypothetical protein|uniref:Uncharacterized protein n=1 Tax=Snodgrassella alvi TaxID=1196083 RepID=A0A2N9XYL1_9NEIS|nr:hypothetical protein [Snodgrassella alvi]PIT52162.1 hypothetical protein BHC44_07935 [Snodgrassella alvi]PIT55619.1 hypothetical protein BHC49_06265 [Snodgrassella alvi]